MSLATCAFGILILSCFFAVPANLHAQLSSENFQINTFSVGTNQSASASSSNFAVQQETGGLFQQPEPELVGTEGSQSTGGFQTADGEAGSEDVEEGIVLPGTDNGDSLPTISAGNGIGGGDDGVGFGNATGTDTRESELSNDLAIDDTNEAADRPGLRTERAAYVTEYLWLWWIIPLLLLLYILRRMTRD